LYLDGNLRSNHWQVKQSQWLRPRIVASVNKTSDPADLHVGLADEIVGRCEPAEVGHGLQTMTLGFMQTECDTMVRTIDSPADTAPAT